jgi:hypothetical protein
MRHLPVIQERLLASRKGRDLARIDMKNIVNDSDRPTREITRQVQPNPALCEHEFEVIAHEEGGALSQCTKCGSLEKE